MTYRKAALYASISLIVAVGAQVSAETARSVRSEVALPYPTPPFGGVMGNLPEDSRPAFPPRVRAPKNAPNILLVMTDDVGFGASSAFGGLVPTPRLDALAGQGLRYNNFHTTAMCSPTRAALLTGRNHHRAGTGVISDMATGFPGYYGEIPRATGTIAETLRLNGYSTAMLGKHHNVPPSELSMSGPFDNWPTSLGFEHFLGFLGPETDQWTPALVRGTSRAVAPANRHLDAVLADDAISWLHSQDAGTPDKPFFLYWAPGTAHAPLQAPTEWIEKFRGKFDQGWDMAREQIFAQQKAAGIVPTSSALASRPSFIPAWESLTPDQRKVASRLMEVYAAQLAHFDYQFGRVVDEIKRMGELDNTLIIFIQGDNGASPEGGLYGTTNNNGGLVNRVDEPDSWRLASLDRLGGPASHAHYPIGWAWATGTPFRYYKRIASDLGGIRNGMVMSWPKSIPRGGQVRRQFGHVIDIAPTILEAAGITPPSLLNGIKQDPLDGGSLLYTVKGDAPERLRTQYFELAGTRSLYQNGWFASTVAPMEALGAGAIKAPPPSPLTYQWELYDLRTDFTQSRNLAAAQPQKLKQLEAEWWRQARDNNVLPLHNVMWLDRALAEPRARAPERPFYIYWGTGVELERGNVAPILRRSFTLTASLKSASTQDNGVLASVGNRFGGWSFFLNHGRPVVVEAHSDQPRHHFKLSADSVIPAGATTVAYTVRYDTESPALDVTIAIDGKPAGATRFPFRISLVDHGESFAIGKDILDRVTDDYRGDGAFSGTIEKVEIRLIDLPNASK